MKGDNRLILLEFNELTPTLLNRFMGQGHLPNFKRFHDQSDIYITDAEESGERLNPWIQWVTVHSGLSCAEHGVLKLDEGQKVEQQCIWDILSAQGRRVLVCGSMNVRYDVPLNGYVLPDPWSTNVRAYPADGGLEAYTRFVTTQVQEHTNDKVPLRASDYVRFLSFMLRHGLSAHTASYIVNRLVKERLTGEGKWKRAVILDKLQFDVFRALYQRTQPHFSTFFLNSTAHMQHAYWRHMDPEPFAVKPTDDERETYGDAVLFGYKEMDGMLGKFMDLAGKDTTLVFSTALGQQPYLDKEDSGGKRFYRPRDFERFLQFAGVTSPHKTAPVMSEQFHVYFESEHDAMVAERQIYELKVDGRRLMKVERRDGTDVFAGAAIFDGVDDDAVLTAGNQSSIPFFDIFYMPDTLKSGKHHPDGALWIRKPARSHTVREGRVSLRTVAPTILAQFGVKAPAYMSAPPLDLDAVSSGPTPERRATVAAAATARR